MLVRFCLPLLLFPHKKEERVPLSRSCPPPCAPPPSSGRRGAWSGRRPRGGLLFPPFARKIRPARFFSFFPRRSQREDSGQERRGTFSFFSSVRRSFHEEKSIAPCFHYPSCRERERPRDGREDPSFPFLRKTALFSAVLRPTSLPPLS